MLLSSAPETYSSLKAPVQKNQVRIFQHLSAPSEAFDANEVWLCDIF